MAQAGIIITGQVKGLKEVQKLVQRAATLLPKSTDAAVKNAALYGHAILVEATPVSKSTEGTQKGRLAPGTIRRRWKVPAAAGEFAYAIRHPNEVIIKTLDGGSRPHIIEARNAKVLAFQSTGISAALEASGIKQKDAPFVFFQRVHHPGTKGMGLLRDNIPKIADKLVSNINRVVQQVVSLFSGGGA